VCAKQPLVTLSIQLANLPGSNRPPPLSSRPKRSEVEGSAVRPAASSNRPEHPLNIQGLTFLKRTDSIVCHPQSEINDGRKAHCRSLHFASLRSG
jgi:hypothetical protein